MFWRWIWINGTTGRLRSGWRAVFFCCIYFTFRQMTTQQHGGSTAPLPMEPVQYVFGILYYGFISLVFISISLWLLRSLDGLPPVTFGLPFRWREAAKAGRGAALGFLCILLCLLGLAAGGFVQFHWRPHGLDSLVNSAIILGLLFTYAAFETIVFRGYLLQTLLRGAGILGALAVSALFYAVNLTVLYLDNPAFSSTFTPLAFINLFLISFVLGLLYLRAGSLWWVIGMSTGWQFCLSFFNLPGNDEFIGHLPLSATTAGAVWLTGGAMGPEGGLVVSGILLLLAGILTHGRYGLSLQSAWWEWREYLATRRILPWDFTVDGRQYQWKILVKENTE